MKKEIQNTSLKEEKKEAKFCKLSLALKNNLQRRKSKNREKIYEESKSN